MEGEDYPTVAEGEHRTHFGGAEGIVVHGRAPDVAAGLAGEGVIDGTHQDGRAGGQEQVKDAAANVDPRSTI